MIRVVTQPLRSFPTETLFPDILREPSQPTLPPVYPIVGPGNANLFFSARASVLYAAVSPLSLGASSSLTRSTTLSAYRSFSPASCRSFAVTILSYVVSPSLSLSCVRSLSLPFSFSPPSLTVDHPLRLPHFHRAHPQPHPFPLGNTTDTATVAANTIAATPPFLHGVARRVPALFLSLWLIRYIVHDGSHGGAAVPGAPGDIRDK